MTICTTRWMLLRSREQHGAIRECHGDLHAGNIVRWAGRLVPFDCLEFDPKLRWIDVMNDIAFLVMDLTAHDRTDLAFTFLNAYVERTGDYAGSAASRVSTPSIAPWCGPWSTAWARNKAPAVGSELQEPSSSPGSRPRRAYVNRPRPALIIMHGLSGSGKSWLSEQLVAPSRPFASAPMSSVSG